ncbi:MAG: RsmB/NOP family class I SAM-dependent RNA methyltransferase [Sphaerochaetaceae bacterium]|jgi:16S rRNA C967 or C1407 C5-methylase (RsmB/RsmF family)|nr:RsmB/NOP family class I SAM-dependent RNA methyltransferase [Sphaerochaetaceae bacterium]MDD4006960.1 RsmB/NOP family class I SAM-dependent RNA methyltransferase [Sphaerochaetaceae bacterium]
MQKKKAEPKALFDEFYNTIYGSRWTEIKQSFTKESVPVVLDETMGKPYYMDRASIAAASALPVSPGDCVLDMCAAPGGKTLILARKLNGNGLLVSNDRSASRRARLHSVIEDCLSTDQKSVITVTGHDSTQWGLHETDRYDAVLLDAPCSSERHVFNDSSALAIWSPARPKHLAIQQFAMLAAALSAVKKGGYILYSTCSICPMENQDVISKLFKKRDGCAQEVEPDSELPAKPEKLEHGQIFMPDVCQGIGPLYYCLLRRIK